jgi:hypothetical protein
MNFYKAVVSHKEVPFTYPDGGTGYKKIVEIERVGMYDESGKWQKWISKNEFFERMATSKIRLEKEEILTATKLF